MSYQEFYEWLKYNRGMGDRSSKDVISRLKRVVKISNLNSNNLEMITIERLESSKDYSCLSIYIKSQLKRAVVLYNEFENRNGKK